jgi:hypothetical protein
MKSEPSILTKMLLRLPVPADDIGTRLTTIGIYALFVSLAIIYFWFGGMKFTAYEAKGS